MKLWRCTVCGYLHKGDEPPLECPQCSSNAENFVEKGDAQRLLYDGKRFDVLLINGSSHKAHNTGIIAGIAEQALRDKGVSYRRFNLNELEVQHCWCCYSMRDSACTYPCRNQLDDAPALHEMILDAKAVLIVSPINWNNMSARLKDFLDRLTCIQNVCLLGKKSMTCGKVLGIIVNGHEDGALKTAMDIYIYFQQMGYVMAPYGFAYRTHGSTHNAQEDNEYFRTDPKLNKDVEGLVNNLVETMKLGIEKRLEGMIACVSE